MVRPRTNLHIDQILFKFGPVQAGTYSLTRAQHPSSPVSFTPIRSKSCSSLEQKSVSSKRFTKNGTNKHFETESCPSDLVNTSHLLPEVFFQPTSIYTTAIEPKLVIISNRSPSIDSDLTSCEVTDTVKSVSQRSPLENLSFEPEKISEDNFHNYSPTATHFSHSMTKFPTTHFPTNSVFRYRSEDHIRKLMIS